MRTSIPLRIEPCSFPLNLALLLSLNTRQGVACCGLAALIAMSSSSVARADAQAQDILKKMAAVYDVNTFQGTATLTQTGTTDDNKPYRLNSIEEVTFQRPNMFYIRSSGPGVGGTQISVFNGKEEISYTSAQNHYSRWPSRGGTSATSVLALLGVRFDVQSGKILSAVTVAGKAAYLVQVTPPISPLPANAPAADRRQLEQLRKMLVPCELAIDKKNYHLLRVTQTTPTSKASRVTEITQQTFNSNIENSAFVFTPPAGAKLISLRAVDSKAMPAYPPDGRPSRMGTPVGGGKGSPVPAPHASPGGKGNGIRP